MIRRPTIWILAAVLAVGAVQMLFTVKVDPHVRCVPTADVDAALAARAVAPQERCLSDATAYHLLADELATSGRYLRPFDHVIFDLERPTAEYPPLFPFALSMLDRIGLDSVARQQLVFGAFMAMAAAGAAALLARRLGLADAGCALVALAVGCQPLLLQANALLMTEGMFAAIVGWLLVAAARLRDAPSGRRAVSVGVLLGLAALTRGEGLIWMPIVALSIALPFRKPNLRLAGVAVLIAGAVVAPWTARNQARFDEVVPVSNNLGTVLDGANCPLTYSGPTIGAWRSTFVPGSTDRDRPCFAGFAIEEAAFSEAEAAARARREGLDYAFDHPGRWPLVAVARLGRSFGVWNPSQQVDLEVLEGRARRWQWAGTVAWWITAPLAAIGLVQRIRRRDRHVAVVLIPIVGVALTTLVTYGNQRFRAGLEPTAIVLAALAIASFVRPGWAGDGPESLTTASGSVPDPDRPVASPTA